MDKYLVSLAFMLLFVEGGWLLQDLKIIDLSAFIHKTSLTSKNEIELGKITQAKKSVKRKTTESLIWEDTESAEKIYAYDSILTLDQSTADLDLFGNAHVALSENTLVTIEPPESGHSADSAVRLRFKHGTLTAATMRNPQSVTAGDYVIAAEANTRIELRALGQSAGEPQDFEINTLAGQTEILDTKTHHTEKVKAGQSVRIENGKAIVQTEKLQIDWFEPVDDFQIYTHGVSAPLNFNWRGSATALEILTQGTSRVQSFDVENRDHLVMNATVGHYMVRLRNGDEKTLSRNIYVSTAPKIYLIKPLSRERFRVNTKINFTWMPTDGVDRYLLEIATDGDFKNIFF